MSTSERLPQARHPLAARAGRRARRGLSLGTAFRGSPDGIAAGGLHPVRMTSRAVTITLELRLAGDELDGRAMDGDGDGRSFSGVARAARRHRRPGPGRSGALLTIAPLALALLRRGVRARRGSAGGLGLRFGPDPLAPLLGLAAAGGGLLGARPGLRVPGPPGRRQLGAACPSSVSPSTTNQNACTTGSGISWGNTNSTPLITPRMPRKRVSRPARIAFSETRSIPAASRNWPTYASSSPVMDSEPPRLARRRRSARCRGSR